MDGIAFDILPRKRIKLNYTRPDEQHTDPSPDVGGAGEGYVHTRSKTTSPNWSLCIICQKAYKKRVKKTVTITTEEVAISILNQIGHDRVTRLDLIKENAQYHVACKLEQNYTVCKLEGNSTNSTSAAENIFDKALATLWEQMQQKLLEGKGFLLSQLLLQYRKILTSLDSASHDSYHSDKLKQKLLARYGDELCFTKSKRMYEGDIVYSSQLSIEDLVQEQLDHQQNGDWKEIHFSDDKSHQSLNEESLIYQAAQVLKAGMKEAKGIEIRPLNVQDLFSDPKSLLPENLSKFLLYLLSEKENYEDLSEKENRHISMIAQDIVASATKNRTKMPKHVALGMAIHHMTRSKELVVVLNHMNHCLSYDDIESIDTHMAMEYISEAAVKGSLIPSNISEGTLVQASADNLDFTEDTIDGRNTTHATTMMLFQRGKLVKVPEKSPPLLNHKIRKRSLENYQGIHPLTTYTSRKCRPVVANLIKSTDGSLYAREEECHQRARMMDIVWLLTRMLPVKLFEITTEQKPNQVIPSWSSFNAIISSQSIPITEIGYCPLINSSSTEGSTIYTILKTLQNMMKGINQASCVITFDLAIYMKAKTIQWENVAEFDNVLIRLGGFHLALNYLAVIGKRYEGSGLEDLLIDSDAYGTNTVHAIMKGKHYSRSVRGHKLVHEALFRVFWHTFINSLDKETMIINQLQECIAQCRDSFNNDDFPEKVEALRKHIPTLQEHLQEYIKKGCSTSHQFSFWWEYIEMVDILLDYIRAERDPDWELHLSAAASMWPYFMALDRQNYSRWLPVYLQDMRSLPDTFPDVYTEFINGNHAVAHTKKRFSQVWSDLALEQSINKDAKKTGGLKGITKNEGATLRWFLTNHGHATATKALKAMANVERTDTSLPNINHHESFENRTTEDEKTVDALQDLIMSGGYINPFDTTQLEDQEPNLIAHLASGRIIPRDTSEKMIAAKSIGQEQCAKFTSERLQESKSFWDPIKRQNIPTFSTLLKSTSQKEKEAVAIVKANGDLFARLLVVSQSRKINLRQVLTYELSDVPNALAYTDRSLRRTDKSALLHELEKDVAVVKSLTVQPRAIIIDGMALLHSCGNMNCHTFGTLAEAYFSLITRDMKAKDRVDVVFDTYKEGSLKELERLRRQKDGKKALAVKINGPNMKLTTPWESFLGNPENKIMITSFLLQEWTKLGVERLESEQSLYISPGNEATIRVMQGSAEVVPELCTNQEEADTKVILHAHHAAFSHETVVIQSPDTDVFVLLLAFAEMIPTNIWFHTGTGDKRRYIPVTDLANNLGKEVSKGLIAIHALTGSDTTSSLAKVGKLSALHLIRNDSTSLTSIENLGSEVPCSQETILSCEQFICQLYAPPDFGTSLNEVRYWLFTQNKKGVECLPPTSDSISQHIMRSNYQAYVWKSALKKDVDLAPPDGHGWEYKGSSYVPLLMTQQAAPKALVELVSCKCKTSMCRNNMCSCKKNELSCTDACECDSETCHNSHRDESD